MQLDKSISAVVTGGASGLGAATVRALAAAGARVAVLDRNAAGAEAMGKEVGGVGLGCDVTDEKGSEAALAKAAQALGAPRILVNCAGIGVAERIVGRDAPMPLANFKRVIDINLIGSFNMLRLAAAAMAKLEPVSTGERGVIINTSSIAAFEGQLGQAAYAASKGAIASLTLPAAREFARGGIRVMAIAPGLLLTPMFDTVPEAAREGLRALTLYPPRLGHPEEFAKLVLHIVDNELLNGEVIRLDGAIRLPPR